MKTTLFRVTKTDVAEEQPLRKHSTLLRADQGFLYAALH